MLWLLVDISVLSCVQELGEIRKSNLKIFQNILVDETNILSWSGLVVPVSSHFAAYAF